MVDNGKALSKITIILTLLIVVAATLFFVEKAWAEKVYRWTFVAADPGTMEWELVNEYAERLKKASGGRFDIKVQAFGSIVPATEELQGLNNGILEMISIPCAWAKGQVPTASLFSGAVGGLSDQAMRAWYTAGGGKELMDEAYGKAYPNLRIIGPPGQILGEIWGYSSELIESPEDIKGLRMRCMGDAGEIFNNMGASVVFLPGGEIYEALQRGIIDWAEWANMRAGWDFGFQEICKYMYVSTTRAPSNNQVFAVNKDAYDSLPDDLQELLKHWVEAFKRERYNRQIESEIATLPKIKEFGVQIIEVPETVVRVLLAEAEKFYQKQGEKDPFFKKVYNSQKEFGTKYREMKKYVIDSES